MADRILNGAHIYVGFNEAQQVELPQSGDSLNSICGKLRKLTQDYISHVTNNLIHPTVTYIPDADICSLFGYTEQQARALLGDDYPNLRQGGE